MTTIASFVTFLAGAVLLVVAFRRWGAIAREDVLRAVEHLAMTRAHAASLRILEARRRGDQVGETRALGAHNEALEIEACIRRRRSETVRDAVQPREVQPRSWAPRRSYWQGRP
jgi:hypothetical protein